MRYRPTEVWDFSDVRIKRFRCVQNLVDGQFAVVTVDYLSENSNKASSLAQDSIFFEQMFFVPELAFFATLDEAIANHNEEFEGY